MRRDLALPLWTSDKSPIVNPVKPGIRIGIYQNSRAGNMDEGWTRFVFDTFNVPFQTLSEAALSRSQSTREVRCDRFAFGSNSGNPRTRLQKKASAGISDTGFKNLARFVEDGGTLICFDGSCGPLIRRWQSSVAKCAGGPALVGILLSGFDSARELDTSNPIARTMMKETDAYFTNSSAFEVTNTPGQLSTPHKHRGPSA